MSNLPHHLSPDEMTTTGLNQAIAEASARGGGRVVLPPGRFFSGTIFLKSHVTLEIPAGTEIVASPDITQYPALPMNQGTPVHLRNRLKARRHFLVAEDVENVTICGGGTLNGNVGAFTPGWEEKEPFQWTGPADRFFVPTLEFLKSRGIRLRDITIRDSPGWTCHICLCDDVRVEGVTLLNYLYAGGSDGFDIDGCHDLWITNCRIETGDDCIVLKNFPDTRSCERIFISNCNFKTLCAGVKIGTESWHDFRQIHFTDSVVHGSSRGFQITCLDGGTVEDVLVDGLIIDTNCGNVFNRPVHLDLGRRRKTFALGEENQPGVGKIRRISISNLSIRTDGRLLFTAGDGGRLEDISAREIRVSYPWIEDPAELGDADTLQGSINCPEAREAPAALVAQNVDGFELRDFRVTWPGDEPPGEEFLPKYRHGKMVRDPREEFHPMPEFDKTRLMDVTRAQRIE